MSPRKGARNHSKILSQKSLNSGPSVQSDTLPGTNMETQKGACKGYLGFHVGLGECSGGSSCQL